ncbi:MAG: hypothetical protein GKR88_20550 [Flavobacteriaceae bacterium]|nr:MAG: hypothetical protein GKR88_20550 [Flavobacteriaceae bacterium]
MSREHFLRTRKGTVSDHHKAYLGMDVPEGYFVKSKQSILDLIKAEKKETKVFYLRRLFQMAASVTLLVVLTIWLQFVNKPHTETSEITFDSILITSLFVEDDSVDAFAEGILVSEVLVEAEKSEQDLENIFINSLFVEDSLIDSYAKESLLNHIVL